jgi:hypothetical protein
MTTRISGLLLVMAAVLGGAACDHLPTAPSATPAAFRNTLCFTPVPPPESGLLPPPCTSPRDHDRGPRR